MADSNLKDFEEFYSEFTKTKTNPFNDALRDALEHNKDFLHLADLNLQESIKKQAKRITEIEDGVEEQDETTETTETTETSTEDSQKQEKTIKKRPRKSTQNSASKKSKTEEIIIKDTQYFTNLNQTEAHEIIMKMRVKMQKFLQSTETPTVFKF